jgi:hypothetical protein
MTPQAHRIMRRLNVCAFILLGCAIAAVVADEPRLAIAAVIPPLFLIVINLEALRAAQGKPEKR